MGDLAMKTSLWSRTRVAGFVVCTTLILCLFMGAIVACCIAAFEATGNVLAGPFTFGAYFVVVYAFELLIDSMD
jgi:hypothetical protein